MGLGSDPQVAWLTYRLPNGMEVLCLNPSEVEAIYQEVFTEESYLRHGIAVEEGACIFDVGANIGLFSLFMARRVAGARLYAFEPIPPIAEVLRANLARHRVAARIFACGIGAQGGEARFTFYPHWSSMSGAYADARRELEVSVRAAANLSGATAQDIEDYLAERFAVRQAYLCPVRTLSEVMREERVERIDLLKIDAEKSELDVLAGLAEEDWTRVEQLAVEVHDGEVVEPGTGASRLARTRALLAGHGYDVTVDQEPSLTGTGMYNLFARRCAG